MIKLGKLENYEKIEDFIFNVKDKSIKHIFFKFISNVEKLTLQDNTGKEVNGYKHTLSAYLSAISDDGKIFITYSALLADLLQTPATKDEEFKTFNDTATNKMKKEIIEVLQKDYANATISAGSCSPTVS